ncbi:MAG: MarR family transcriptional regulator [Burkholderiales bacterium]|nr:MAG: MarR family transcriptional regulator [Burkholderiales bacterium]
MDQSALAHLIGYHLARASVPARRAFAQRIGRPLGLRPAEFSILQLLARNGDVTQKQLAQALLVSAPAVTVLLDRLGQRGLVCRERSARDRRAQLIRLTGAGAALARRAHRASLSMERQAFGALGPAERARLIALLERCTPAAGR